VAASLNNLAALYRSQGRYSDAEPLCRDALEMSKRLLGDEHPAVATSLNNLALLYAAQEQFEKAVPLLEQALRTFRQLLGDEHPHTQILEQNVKQIKAAILSSRTEQSATTLRHIIRTLYRFGIRGLKAMWKKMQH
jgi:tetratricopeptide (TPR) repeat protein